MMKGTQFNTKIERKTHQIDATGQAVGRLATQIAHLLMGKQKSNYTPQTDNGDFVVLINSDKIKFTGKKLEQKNYYSHSGHPGGLRVTQLKFMLKDKPHDVIKLAVKKMLPKNRLQPLMIKRLMFK